MLLEKRKPSTRNRGEPPLKQRPSTPPAPPPPPPEPIEKGLPVRFKETQDLPTLSEQQGHDLSLKQYQSISESGVLAASIDRSRQQWLTEGVFERYWTKPSKKKAMGDAPNPPKETMVKLGVCSMTIEPHIFDITLYTVREHQPSVPPVYGQPLPQPIAQHGPSYDKASFPPRAHDSVNAGSLPQIQGYNKSQTFQQTLPPFREGFAQFGPQGASPSFNPPLIAQPPNIPKSSPNGIVDMNNNATDGAQSQDAKPADPVIQMLATRAASDHGLKALMRVVASGNATQVQLKEFQDHIDELNGMIQSNNNPTQSHPSSSAATVQQEHADLPLPPLPVAPAAQVSTSAITFQSNGYLPMGSAKPDPLNQYYSQMPQPVKAKSTYTPKPEVSAIVFDFAAGSGDRYLFPRYSILEYLPGSTQVIVSFLITRRGSAAASGSYKNSITYYQPVTMRLSTHNPRTLEPLSRIVAPVDEVQRYMNDIMDKMTPADHVFLATQLPRSSDSTEIESRELSLQPDHEIVRTSYSPPNSLVPFAA